MKTTKKELQIAVKLAAKVSPDIKTPWPAFAKINNELGRGLMYTTNMEYESEFRFKDKFEGSVIVDFYTLAEVVKELAPSDVELFATAESLVILQGGERILIKNLGIAEDVIPVKLKDQNRGVERYLNNLELNSMIRVLSRVLPFVSVQEARYILNGILFQDMQGTVRCAGTDGRALSVGSFAQRDLNGIGSFVAPAVPVEKMVIMCKFLWPETAVIKMDGNILSFETEHASCSTRLLEGKYPDIDAVFPVEPGPHIVLDRKQFHRAIRKALACVNKAVGTIMFGIDKHGVNLAADGVFLDFKAVVNGVVPEGVKLELKFNPVYLERVLDTSTADTIIMEFVDNVQPVVMQDNLMFYVVMPVNEGKKTEE